MFSKSESVLNLTGESNKLQNYENVLEVYLQVTLYYKVGMLRLSSSFS
jgi:hypothetical protein